LGKPLYKEFGSLTVDDGWVSFVMPIMYSPLSTVKAYPALSKGVPTGKWYVMFQHGAKLIECPFGSVEFPLTHGANLTVVCYKSNGGSDLAAPISTESWASIVYEANPITTDDKMLGISRNAGGQDDYENMTMIHTIPARTGRPAIAVVVGFRNDNKYIALLSNTYDITLELIGDAYNDVDAFLRAAGMPPLFKDGDLGGELGEGWTGSTLVLQ
jgi:hypothetical protein